MVRRACSACAVSITCWISGPAAQPVQHLGRAALHARALAGRHHHHIDCCHSRTLRAHEDVCDSTRLGGIILALALALGLAGLQRASSWATTTCRTWPTGGSTVTSTSATSRRPPVRDETRPAARLAPRSRSCPAWWTCWRRMEQTGGRRPSRRSRPARSSPRCRRASMPVADAGRAGASLALAATPDGPRSCATCERKYRRNNESYREDWVDAAAGRAAREALRADAGAAGDDLRPARRAAARGAAPAAWSNRSSIPRASWPSGSGASRTCCRRCAASREPGMRRSRRRARCCAATSSASQHSPDPAYRAYQEALLQEGCRHLRRGAREHHAPRSASRRCAACAPTSATCGTCSAPAVSARPAQLALVWRLGAATTLIVMAFAMTGAGARGAAAAGRPRHRPSSAPSRCCPS